MCFREVTPEVFTKHHLSKATDGSGGGWRMEHRMKANATNLMEATRGQLGVAAREGAMWKARYWVWVLDTKKKFWKPMSLGWLGLGTWLAKPGSFIHGQMQESYKQKDEFALGDVGSVLECPSG